MQNPMRVVVFASQKGGSGKTTLTGHLAVEASRTGFGRVAVIDTDPQASLAKWCQVRHAEEPVFLPADTANLRSTLVKARAEGFDLVCIDTPPSITRAISEVVGFADLVVVPTRPSPHDIRAVGPTVDIVDWHKKPLVFVLNGASPRARITSDAAVALSQHGTVAPTFINHRVDYAASMIDGRTVMEVKAEGRSAGEIRELWAYIAERLLRMEALLNGIPDPADAPHVLSNINGLGQKIPAFGRRLSQ